MAGMPSSSSGGYMQMLMAALKSLGADMKPSQTDASGSALEQAVTAPGNPGSAVTPQMAAVAQQALPGTNMQGATVAGAMPNAPTVSGQQQSPLQQALPFIAQGLGGAAGLGGADPKEKMMKPKPAFRGQGTPPKNPIAPPAPPMAPASPGSQGPGGGGVPSVGMFLASPQGQQLMKQMQNAIGIGAR